MTEIIMASSNRTASGALRRYNEYAFATVFDVPFDVGVDLAPVEWTRFWSGYGAEGMESYVKDRQLHSR